MRDSTEPLLEWLSETGSSKVAIHLEVDVVDSDEVVHGLGVVNGGPTRAQVQRVVAEFADVAEVVGLTVAEFIPRSVLAAIEMLASMPLVSR